MSFRPALADPQGGPITGKESGPMSLAKPAINWSHLTGKRHRLKGLEWHPGRPLAAGQLHCGHQPSHGAALKGSLRRPLAALDRRFYFVTSSHTNR